MKPLRNAIKFPIVFMVAALLSSCGNTTPDGGSDETNDQSASSGQVIAVVNGEEVTIHELNAELSRIRLPENADIDQVKANALQALVLRKVYEQKAIEAGIDRQPNTIIELRRAKSALLASSFISSKRNEVQPVTRAEAEQFVFDNADIFAERMYYIFESIVIDAGQLTEQQKDDFESLANMDEIEKELQDLNIQALRKPFTAYSERLPKAMRDQLPTLVRDRTVFFVVQGNTETIVRYREGRPAPLTGTEAIDIASKILAQGNNKEFLANLRAQTITEAKIEYLGEFSDLTDQQNILPDETFTLTEEPETNN
ncbi:hypothetical protein GCM10017044_20400 [Kordiimonas sediminis]|uniref:Peptidyl-prolyl cis-trans isomerase, EpsD family n=1 Tax=Kordiimonas sediminis TaxID=1735581 RepID=A0A919E8V6_9PROT|nr:SurA N-terminal domain-containing protein [Kordiimonas sediminis]GHF25514.1 hypothetical protein GCM10017044_20400 [Kordiimonas sediminis]